jgi:hypothetical protein
MKQQTATVTHLISHITSERIKALADNFYSEGWYTQAKEITELGRERDMLIEACHSLQEELRQLKMKD